MDKIEKVEKCDYEKIHPKARSMTEFYQEELDFLKAQKRHGELHIRNIKRWAFQKVRGLHKEIDEIDVRIKIMKQYKQKWEEIEKNIQETENDK